MAYRVGYPLGYPVGTVVGYPQASEPSIPEILAPVGSSWKLWLTTFDPTLPEHPGVTFTGTVGVDAVMDSWTDQRGGFVFPDVNSPVYGADGVHFGGRPVVQCATSGSKYLLGNVATVLASGSRPMMVIVYRVRNGGTADVPLQTANGATFVAGFADNDVTTTRSYFQQPNGSLASPAGQLDNSPAVLAGWVTASGGCFLSKNGVTIANAPASTSAIAANINRIAIGANRNGGGVSDSSIAEIFMFDAYIGDDIFAQLLGAIQAKV